MALALRFDLVTAQISTVELPAARFVVSSKPYPIETDESLRLGASLIGGVLSTGLYVMEPDRAVLGVALPSGSLRSPLQTYACPPENVTLGASLASGSLRQTFITYAMAPENITLGAALSSGALKVALIQYTNWPAENLTLSATLSSGTLA